MSKCEIAQIDHIVMTVADMSKTIDFYCSVLGTTAVEFVPLIEPSSLSLFLLNISKTKFTYRINKEVREISDFIQMRNTLIV